METTKNPDRFTLIVYGLALGMMFVIAPAVEKGADVLLINGWNTPFLDDFFRIITHLGDGLVFIPIILILAVRRYDYALMAVASWILHGVLSTVFKRLIFPNQLRPTAVIDDSLLHYVEGVEVHYFFSFPSGHTMTAFCAAFLVSLVYRNRPLSVIFLLVALLVGCSRIYLLQHFLIDVAGGALIGVVSAYVVWVLFERMKKPEWMSKRFG